MPACEGRTVNDDGKDGRRSGGGAPGLEARVAELQAELSRRQERVERLEAMVELQRSAIAQMQGSVAWQVATRLRYVRDRVMSMSPLLTKAWSASGPKLKRLVRRHVPGVAPEAERGGYDEWLLRHAVTAADVAALREQAATLARPPTFSLIVRVADVPEALLRRSLESVRSQAWERWELCAVGDATLAPHLWASIDSAARADPRVRAVRLPAGNDAAAAPRRAVELTRGELVAFLDAGGELAPEALLAMAARLASEPDLDVIYSDEDRLDASGKRVEPFFKPDWSPDLLLSMNYLGHLTVARSTLVQEVGGPRPELAGSQDHDLLLRLSERTSRIGHIARVLYHGRREPAAAGAAIEPGVRAIEAALVRRGLPGKVESQRPGLYGVRYRVRGEPLVSIVMPTRDKPALLRACVESLERRTRWARWELIVVDNGSKDPKALAYLETLARRHRVLRDERPFNWSALNNRAVREARGEHLLFMNNDMEVIAPDWMEALLEHSQRPDVGAVGARLLYPDGRVQHAGVVLGIGSAAGHAFKYLPDGDPGYGSLAHAIRDVSAVTGACMMVPRGRFEEVGGFEERMPVAYNDIDFCLKLRRAGHLIVYTPFATLYHHESATRRYEHPADDEVLLKVRWRDELLHDPYYSPHLTRAREDYSIGA
jgi:O-antigen biosynthesis protein